jgi:hypothetical protein
MIKIGTNNFDSDNQAIKMIFNAALFLLSLHCAHNGDAFIINPKSPALTTAVPRISSIQQTASDATDATLDTFASSDGDDDEDSEEFSAPVRAPLKLIGPYVGLGLNFPDLATASQRSQNISGVALDFVLDTAANINTLNGQVAQELKLEIVDEAPGGFSASGPIAGGHIYMLGSCKLEGLPEDEQFTFMENLTASALRVASPAAAGLLSLPFFYCFEGGVEFEWKEKVEIGEDGQEQRLPPSVTFYDSPDDSAYLCKDMTAVAVNLCINGVTIPELFDTVSPVTVLNAQAAEKAGVKTVNIGNDGNEDKKSSGFNPFGGIAYKLKDAQAKAQAAARGDVLTIAGSGGGAVDLVKSDSKVDVSLPSKSGDDSVDFESCNIYVGNIPGLAALNALGDDSPAGAVLGMDILRSKPKMLFLARDGEVYF